jgi:hypothetical protein
MATAFALTLGFLIGIAFDLLPHALEIVLNMNVCRESCPAQMKAISLSIYAAMPIAWATILVRRSRQALARPVLPWAAVFSLALMTLLTWGLYAYQHP